MEWPAAITSLGVPAVVGAIVTTSIGYFFSRKLGNEQARIKIEGDRRLLLLKETLERIDRLESDLLKRRGDAYGEIWTLTGALNLFGQANPVNCAEVSENLTRWYFSRGQLLTDESKPRYFLVQEVLNFFRLQSISLNRPSDELLYGSEKRTIEALRAYRTERLQIPPKKNDESYELLELADYVTRFKTKIRQSRADVTPEDAWLLLQFVMSAFRSCVTRELGSREVVNSSPAEAAQAGGGL